MHQFVKLSNENKELVKQLAEMSFAISGKRPSDGELRKGFEQLEIPEADHDELIVEVNKFLDSKINK